jgi:hypothetical protein
MKPLLVSVITFALATSKLCAQARPWDEVEQANLAPLLLEAGFDRNSAESLIRAIRQDDILIRHAGVYGLRKLPPTRETIEELRRHVTDREDSIFIVACQSLEELEDKSWVPYAAARVGSLREIQQFVVVGLLARAGDYRGWPTVKRGITSPDDGLALRALGAVPNFAGMKDATGKEVDIEGELELLSSQMPPKAKVSAANLLKAIRTEKTQKAKAIK